MIKNYHRSLVGEIKASHELTGKTVSTPFDRSVGMEFFMERDH